MDGKKAELNQPVDYWLEFTDGLLTLHFTLPFKTPAKTQNLSVEIYDPAPVRRLLVRPKDPVKLIDCAGGLSVCRAAPG